MPNFAVDSILTVLWVAFALYWTVSAFRVKRDVRKNGSYGLTVTIRLIVIVAVVYLLNLPVFRPMEVRLAASLDHPDLALQVVGLVLTVAGIAFAVWARVHLGRNWSPVPALKEGHELITSGPYRFVRNPIYTGILVGLFGSSLAGGLIYWIVFLVCLVSFVYRVFSEDRLMMQQFPETYPAYRRRTKALIPFVV